MKNYDHKLVVDFIGDPKVGKSSIIKRGLENKFDENYTQTVIQEIYKIKKKKKKDLFLN